MPSSLSNRVFALYGITFLLFIGGGLGLFLKYQFQRQVEDTKLASIMLIEVVTQAVQDSVVIGDFDSVQKILNKGVQGSQFSSALFIAAGGGKVAANNNPLVATNQAPQWLVQRVQRSLDDVSRTVSVGGKDYGVLRLQFDAPAVATGLWSLSVVALGGGLAALATGLLIIRLALSGWLGGLERLRQTVQALGTGAAQATDLVIANAPAEIQSLVDMVNQTATLVREHESIRRVLDQHAIVMLTDGEGIILYANAHFCEATGYSGAELIGRNQREIRSDEHPPAYYDKIWEAVSRGELWHGELASRKRNGDVYWADVRVVPILAADGVSQQYISIHTDITARKLAEHDREVTNKVLAVRSAELHAVLDNISQGVALISPDDSVVFLGKQTFELLEIPASLHQSDYPTILAFQTKRGDFGTDFDLVEEAARDHFRKVGTKNFSGPAQFTRRTLSGRTLEIKTKALLAGGFVRTFTDVTDYIEALTRAEQASNAKGQFLANMSHEIRTPMAAILGLLTMLQDTAMTETQLDFVLKADGAARSLLSILNDILDFSKVEAGKMTLHPRPFHLDKMLKDLTVILSSIVGDKPVTVRMDVAPDVPRVLLGDDMRLQQVLINLGGNAVKFTSAGDVVLRVRQVERGATDAVLEFAMSDSGIGIAPENQAHIFNGFSQGEASTTRRFGGTGLGLSIASRLVALFGGTLQLNSVEGQGSTFHFQIRFPLANVAAADSVQPALSGATAPEPVKRLEGLRLLVVEDNKLNQMVAEHLLSREGADVTMADDGQLGVAAVAAAQPPFDAVLMDLQMPVMDGYAATRTIRQELGLTTLPIIAMTANAMATDRTACLEAGMDDHIGKPFEIDHLVATLLRLTGR